MNNAANFDGWGLFLPSWKVTFVQISVVKVVADAVAVAAANDSHDVAGGSDSCSGQPNHTHHWPGRYRKPIQSVLARYLQLQWKHNCNQLSNLNMTCSDDEHCKYVTDTVHIQLDKKT